MKQKLSRKALLAKRKRDLAYALTPRRRKMKAENQRKRRAAIKAGKNIKGKSVERHVHFGATPIGCCGKFMVFSDLNK